MSASPSACLRILGNRTGKIRRVAILFAGGPAPAANAVISTAAASFLRNGIEVLGVLNGYSHLVEYRPRPSAAGGARLRRCSTTRSSAGRGTRRGIMIGTARTNPGQGRLPSQPTWPTPSRPPRLRTVHEALASLGVDALVSIGGDDTLKTANKFKMFQDHLPAGRAADRGRPRPQDDRQRLPRHRLHLRLLHGRRDAGRRDPQPPGRRRGDAAPTSSPRRMGRSAGWLAYGAAIAGEASLVISVEDIDGSYRDRGDLTDPETGVSDDARRS